MTQPNIPGYANRETLTLTAATTDGYSEEAKREVLVESETSLRIMDSTGLFAGYHLLFGDRITVRRTGEARYEVVAPVLPSEYRHFYLMTDGAPESYTRILHELGGEWDCELMMTRIHVPADRIDELMARAGGFDLYRQSEMFSGVADLDEDDASPNVTGSTRPDPTEPARAVNRQPLVVLLGDSIFDNAPYVPAGLTVIDQLRERAPSGWRARLHAIDGSIVTDVSAQLRHLPPDTTHLVLSIGGNNALNAIEILSWPVKTVGEALDELFEIRRDFQLAYRAMLWEVIAREIPLAVCTIYDAVPDLGPEQRTALCLFNDTITREALATGTPIIDLRAICTEPADYSDISPIEPSAQGGAKIARAIIDWVAQHVGQADAPRAVT